MLPCIFPAFPDFSEFDIYASMVPAKEVGGDFYDFFMLDDKRLVLVIADVSGKGVPAALFMVITKTLIKNQALAGNYAGDIFTAVNSRLCENNEANMFVTAWMGIYDITSGKLTYVNAGHNHPLLRHKNGQYEPLKARAGFVLGGMKGIKYRSSEIYLGEGDSLFLYTDGVTEATDSAMQLYGEARLQTILNSTDDIPPSAVLSAVTDDIQHFVKKAPQFDDITMLAIKIFKCEKPSLTVKASIDSTDAVMEFIDCILERNGCPDNAKKQFHIVIDEIFSNISNYSKSESVTLTCLADNQGAKITFSDSGVPYNPLEFDDPDFYNKKTHGHSFLRLHRSQECTDDL
jgi:sigma-B regulation protein RsbU (phosphoserine phosphatase)